MDSRMIDAILQTLISGETWIASGPIRSGRIALKGCVANDTTFDLLEEDRKGGVHSRRVMDYSFPSPCAPASPISQSICCASVWLNPDWDQSFTTRLMNL